MKGARTSRRLLDRIRDRYLPRTDPDDDFAGPKPLSYAGDGVTRRVWKSTLREMAARGERRLLIYGCGGQARKLLSWMDPASQGIELVAFIDSRPRQESFLGYPVFSPARVGREARSGTVLFSSFPFEEEMVRLLGACLRKSPRFRRRSLYRGALFHRTVAGLSPAGDAPWVEEFSGPRTIVYVTLEPFFNLLRQSLALRRLGWKTLLIGVRQENLALQRGYFDRVVQCGDLPGMRRLCGALSPQVFHLQGWLLSYAKMVLIRSWCRQGTVICETMDHSRLLLSQQRHYVRYLSRPAEEIELDWAGMREIWDHFPGVLHPYREEVRKLYRGWGYGDRGSRQFSFPSYPCAELFAPARRVLLEDPVRFVFIGGIPTDHWPDRVFGDAKLNQILPLLLKQGLKISIYNNPLLARNREQLERLYPRMTEMTRAYPNLKFRCGYPPERLRNIIPSHHFGLMLYDFSHLLVRPYHYAYILPSKFFHYLELGLPVLVSEEMTAVADLVRRHGLGMVVPFSRMKELRGMIQEQARHYPAWRKNVLKYRASISMDKQARRLARWYASL